MNTKTAYQYDVAGLYYGETVADESPLEPGVYLVPALCTLTPPPATWPESKWPRWNGRKWALIKKPVVPEPAAEPTPEEKLRRFLAENPDVSNLISQ